MEPGHATMRRVDQPGRCGCGEPLDLGELVGVGPTGRELLCLWCLADLQAGRRRPRRRMARPGVPAGWLMPVATSTRLAPARPRRSGKGPSAVGSAVLALALVVVAMVARTHILGGDSSSGPSAAVAAGLGSGSKSIPIPGTDLDISLGSPIDMGTGDMWPPAPSDARQKPLRRPPGPSGTSTTYAFMHTKPSGEPVRFDPCRPIHLVVNGAIAPPQADQLLREAAAAVSTASGLVLIIDGATNEQPTAKRGPLDAARYGNQWSPVLVAWTDPSVAPGLAGRVAGMAGPVTAPYRTDDQMHWVSGSVLLDAPTFTEILQRPNGHEEARGIVMHELAHLVGLTHVQDTRELMAEENSGRTSFGPGDREGLRRLGGGPCFSK